MKTAAVALCAAFLVITSASCSKPRPNANPDAGALRLDLEASA